MNLTTPHRWTIAALLVAIGAITAGSLRADAPSVEPDPVMVPQLDIVTAVSSLPVAVPAPVSVAQIIEPRTVDSAVDDEVPAESDDLGVDSDDAPDTAVEHDDAGDDETGDDDEADDDDAGDDDDEAGND
jgi:hypothetical protein